MDYVTDGGLVVTDRRHTRASEFPQIDPRSHDPNGNPASTVGPESRAGNVVVGPTSTSRMHAEAWDGWPAGWDTPYMTEQGAGSAGIVTKVTTAMTCIDLNSRQVASFPTYGIKSSTAEPFDLPTWSLNPAPQLYSSWSEFVHSTVNTLLIRGECFTYALNRYANGYPAQFANLNPDAVALEWIDGGIEYMIDGNPIDPADICHIKYQSWPGRLHGISPLEWCARSLVTSGALERYATNLATRGGIPWAVLKANRNLDERQVLDVQSSWVNAAARRDGAPAILGTAFDLQPLSFSPEQMALLDMREFDDRRIAAAFGVPGYLVNISMGQGSSVTYGNASQLFGHHFTATLRPLTTSIAQSWSQWLLPYGSRMEFNPDRYVQPPLAERSKGYETLFNLVDPVTGERGIYIDEVRAAERLPPAAQRDTADLAAVQRMTGG